MYMCSICPFFVPIFAYLHFVHFVFVLFKLIITFTVIDLFILLYYIYFSKVMCSICPLFPIFAAFDFCVLFTYRFLLRKDVIKSGFLNGIFLFLVNHIGTA